MTERRRWARIGAAALAAAAMVAWWLQGRSLEPTDRRAPAGAITLGSAAMSLPVGASVGAAAAVALPEPAAAPGLLPDGRIEICGFGRVLAPELPIGASLEELANRSKAAWELQLEQQVQALQRRTGRELAGRGDEFSRLLGLLLQDDRAGAAQLARRSEDPRVYALAWRQCQRGGMAVADGACAQLNLRRWAQLDPRNASPWLELLMEAQRRGETSAAEEALYQAARAARVDSGLGDYVGGVQERLPADAASGTRGFLLMQLFGEEASAMHFGAAGAAARACDSAALRDANRRQTCAALARLLMSEGRDLMAVNVGVVIGERLQLPAREMLVTRAQVQAVQRRAVDVAGPPQELTSCRGLRRLDDWVRQQGREGEWRGLMARMREAEASAPR
ncbi:hypothetical protein G8A07_18550 [Roseateles sp. DAIF2]|uniref:hypothetical protein n=1 Tax=Roseateles sp. DAIF2 TaxID=2714952 RepID=UPI0018A2FDDB|nr:hypothetical protein [Roseateles sp. DAIF2]QPF74720.1 hypothetical protein G8A07_18550 [Roseateles sp. DAIF2]